MEISKEKLESIKKTAEIFKERLLEKFSNYVTGISILPPGKSFEQLLDFDQQSQQPAQQNQKTQDQNQIPIIVLVDDTDSQKMSKLELRKKLSDVVQTLAKEVDKNLKPYTLIYSELWQYCFDGKTEILSLLAQAIPIHDAGMMSAVKIAEIHKEMVLKKFEKYIVAYVLAGSLVQGRATHESDIDVFVVIDDTDVKKMTRFELKDRLRALIAQMGFQAGEMTGIKNKLNIQTYILTDFWDSIKEANPVIFTFLRDGVPFYDRGIFMPWKQLLRMGKIKPSMESIELFMSSAEQMLERTKYKLKEIAMEDTFWTTIYPSQAALMLYGLPPPTPKEAPDMLRKIFVKKEKILEEKYVKLLEQNLKLRKDLEHGTKKDITGAEIDEFMKNTKLFSERMTKLFETLEKKQTAKRLTATYDHLVSILRDALRLNNITKIAEKDISKLVKETLIETNELPKRVLLSFDLFTQTVNDFKSKNITDTEVDAAIIKCQDTIRTIAEYIHRKRGSELAKSAIKVKYGNKYAEVLILNKTAYITHDLDSEQRTYTQASISKTGELKNIKEITLDELEKAIVHPAVANQPFLSALFFNDLKKVFGTDVEVLLN